MLTPYAYIMHMHSLYAHGRDSKSDGGRTLSKDRQATGILILQTKAVHNSYISFVSKQNAFVSPSPPPRGLCGVPFCLFRGAAGLPLTSRRADLHGGGPLEAGLSPLTSGLTLSRRLGLSVPPPAPLCCSIPRKTAGGAPSTVPEAGETQTK